MVKKDHNTSSLRLKNGYKNHIGCNKSPKFNCFESKKVSGNPKHFWRSSHGHFIVLETQLQQNISLRHALKILKIIVLSKIMGFLVRSKADGSFSPQNTVHFWCWTSNISISSLGYPLDQPLNPLRTEGGHNSAPPGKNAFFDVKFSDLFKNIFRK